ncbi:MAG: hypothetical protein GY757_52545, partial [bacterium]|nr:hypothetical protein [bacterium]
MKRLVSVMVIGLLILALTACMSNDNPESVIEDFIDGTDDFVTDMDKAD